MEVYEEKIKKIESRLEELERARSEALAKAEADKLDDE